MELECQGAAGAGPAVSPGAGPAAGAAAGWPVPCPASSPRHRVGPNLLVPPHRPPPEPLARQSGCRAWGELGPCLDLPQPTEEAQGNTGLGGWFIVRFGLYKNNLQK